MTTTILMGLTSILHRFWWDKARWSADFSQRGRAVTHMASKGRILSECCLTAFWNGARQCRFHTMTGPFPRSLNASWSHSQLSYFCLGGFGSTVPQLGCHAGHLFLKKKHFKGPSLPSCKRPILVGQILAGQDPYIGGSEIQTFVSLCHCLS